MVDRDELRDAAVAAELATGRRELTRLAALRHVALRLARMAGGTALCVLGLAMLVLPGPGLLVIAAGLMVLSIDVAWAARLLRWVRSKAPGIDEEGPLPKGAIVLSGALVVVAGASLIVWLIALR